MYRILRIVCCCICAVILAALIFIFVYAGWIWGLISLVAAGVFFGLTLFFKNLQEKEENKLNPPPTVGDFITGPVTKDGKEE